MSKRRPRIFGARVRVWLKPLQCLTVDERIMLLVSQLLADHTLVYREDRVGKNFGVA